LFKDKIAQPNGIVLVTGPTGSGKTTTLYAALNTLKSPHVNISTVEDPIEYNLTGINQTQVKPEIDLTFSSMLRALLRQDPNIIMVGEIRDHETLEIAIQASLTGHLVLSTLHTNSAIATISRLIDMGAEPFLLTTSLRLIVAQRLLRLNCQKCQTHKLSDANHAAALKLGLQISSNSVESTGCPYCHQTGFSGRTAVYELLVIDDDIKNGILNGKPESEILRIAKTHGFITMLESAQKLIDLGKTTPLEILREINV
jgi:type II secretory ATPase GspE/PulE/Tfp pilus assembly ATPase PilB-like protein